MRSLQLQPSTDGLGEKYVRITGAKSPNLIEFEFAIGDPALYVELLLPEPAFAQFCRDQQVTFLDADEAASEASDWTWSLRDAQAQRFR